MYQFSHTIRQNTAKLHLLTRVLAILLVVALAGCILLGILYGRVAGFPQRTQDQLLARVRACCTDAKSLAEKLSTSVASNTASQLASIRQGIYAMDQLNTTAINLLGQSGRLVPDEAIAALYSDIDTYFSIIQTNTVSVLETRALLLNHLTALQGLLAEL